MHSRIPIGVPRALAAAGALAALSLAALAAPAQGATFTVVKTTDSGVGTLRQAILDANAQPGPHRIEFDIPGDPAVAQVIAPLTDLDTITETVTINGYTQPGARRARRAVPAELRVVIDATLTNRGLELATDGSVVRGLAVHSATVGVATADGIVVAGDENRIEGNHLGTDGTQDLGNDDAGVQITGDSNVVGGTRRAARNVISGNNEDGVRIEAGTGNTIQGNLIGTDETGTLDLGNSETGVEIVGSANLVGGSRRAARNLVSANNNHGVSIVGGGNQVTGNLIGTDITGSLDLGNSDDGVRIDGGGNRVGGRGTGEGNVISGNNNSGVRVETGTGNRIQGNLIGTNAAADAAVDNGLGIQIDSAGTLIGGVRSGTGNVISGNDTGIFLSGDANTVRGNRIGTTPAGDAGLPNDIGVVVDGGDGNTIGGRTARRANVISGNFFDGVVISADPNGIPAEGNRVQGNRIGTNAAGTTALANGRDGVLIADSDDNTIGGLRPGAGNLIAGNGEDAVHIQTVGGAFSAAGNRIFGNLIGTDAAGTAALPNGDDGVNADGADGNIIGGPRPAAANVIAANGDDGVDLEDADSNTVLGNAIGTDAARMLDLGNGGSGVRVRGDSNDIGDDDVAAPMNAITFNGEDGVTVEDGTGNRIVRNAIFANDDLGIDLHGSEGVTDNDLLALDADSGANDLQNFPQITAASVRIESDPGPGGIPQFSFRTAVDWTLDSEVLRSFRIEFYANPVCDDPSQHGEGQVFLGSADATTDAAGQAAGSSVVAFAPAGQLVTATATSLPVGISETSEFSPCEEIG